MTTAVESFDTLRRKLTGALALPGDPLYAELATGFNVAITAKPAAVVEARDAQDVAEAVRFAAATGRAAGVQATGHGLAGTLDEAVLVHTGKLDECVVHPDGWARVGAGVRWQQVVDAAAPYGLAPLCGSAPGVGVVGYTTGGGLGPVARTFGWASDRVRAVEIVTGDGVLRRVTANDEPDLFWGVRGGKGALGIVTALEFDLVPLPSLYAGALYFAGADAAAVLHRWREWSSSLPLAATTSLAFLQLPPMPGVPEPLAGRFTVAVRFAWTESAESGAAVLAPMRAAATPIIDLVQTIPYAAIGMVHADPTEPMPVIEETDLLASFPAEAADALLATAGPDARSPQVMVELRQLGGALAEPGEHESALCHRDAAFSLILIGVPVPPIAEAIVPHAAAVRAALDPWLTGGALPNLSSGTGAERIARSYDPATLARLVEIAGRFDPANVLRVGQVPVRQS
ncbi:FAD-linked oxidase [Paractinoplanes abujensis]|uniref:FAD/FMN-containing dehydrogenase n=1 Tax=Paractinoplanes abujensis TaxID=882441 RepID=A0A7W7G0W1_9ACTN|nr:FAD-binding oxidoreductase [Actinoplanes abujensis]MBB4691585.1 FAD/FMN-containing dehydrogenase [Actinoplanes abujensis]GID16995.1 FAD-linked oxidase [Actinoplanes abujensis]